MSGPEPAASFARRAARGEVSIEESVAKTLEECEKTDSRLACFNTICGEPALSRARALDGLAKEGKAAGRLFGVPVSVKDNICTKGVRTTAGSAIISDYVPPMSATAVERIEAEGGIVVGKTAMDEFGFGGFCVNVGKGFRVPRNPLDEKRVTGGSSGGCGAVTAALAAAGIPHASLAESTGGSITSPACFCGVVGITPTYGRVSRWGLIDFASSLDKIGSIGANVEDAALLLEAAQGADARDMTSRPEPAGPLADAARGLGKRFRLGVPKEFFEGVDPRVSDLVWGAVKKLEAEGSEVGEVSLPTAKYAVPAYYLIAVSEASTNLARFNGTRFGLQREPEQAFGEYFSEIRAEGFGDEAKRRVILGTFARMAGYRGKYYLRAMKVRTRIIAEFARAFEKYDALVAPSMPILPPTFEEVSGLAPHEAYALDLCTTPPNIAGIPHASVPAGMAGGLPAGAQVMCAHLQERRVVEVASALEAVSK
ncbi:MAG: amidase family protein [Candidatus ainarchaeum sp.]|nr:amidase family protein [Candidatus ainarchaeum sp.]